ncbi:protein PML-like isoform X2 [Thamnophis elegans]|uniref:protein PML-like isoform X2 n=1 Tax=Thamnophis elegans TaxID=35005 RepID=UPI001376C9D6|nr:protein PML-like isoform X2 [Thamnophis elegans]
MAGEAASEPEAPAFQLTAMNQEFQFLLCDRCHREVACPKLLPCLHNLCSQCLEENEEADLCVICGTPYFHLAESPEKLDNVFFVNLQNKLGLYQKVTGSKDLVCDSCKKEAKFWCSTCEDFLCLSCFQSHQKYLKHHSPEIVLLKEFQTESCKGFLSTIRKPMFCSKAGHNTQKLSLYCRQCSQSMCNTCAQLDRKHMGQHCDISQEIQSRQSELQNMIAELMEKKNVYDKTSSKLENMVKNMEKIRNEMQELIQQKIEEMIHMLQAKGEGFLAEVEAHHNHQVQDVKKKLQEMEGVVQRITSSQRLVEKLHLYASGQEVLEMHPFLKKSMMELRQKQPSTVKGIKVRNILDINSQLQNLLERMTKDNEAVPAKPQTKPQENSSRRLLGKRECIEQEKNTEHHPKMVKIVPLNDEEPGTSYGATGGSYVPASQERLRQSLDDTLQIAHNYLHSSAQEDNCSMNISSEEESTDDDDDDDDDNDEAEISILPLTSPGDQKSPVKYPLCQTEDVSSQSKIIFFDLKSLSGNKLHLVALGEDANIFSFTISCLETARDRVFEYGMDGFLKYLSSLQRPILVGYNLWSMDLPGLLDALQKINKEEQFKASIQGFLDALPLIREMSPEISNYSLNNLDKTYFWGELDSTKADDCAQTLKNLCTIFEINILFQRRPLITCFSFRCYASLQPLLREKVLSMPSVQTLALHNISLLTLQSIYQSDPKNGLKELCRCLIGEKNIQKLSKICKYFENLPSSSQSSSLPEIH